MRNACTRSVAYKFSSQYFPSCRGDRGGLGRSRGFSDENKQSKATASLFTFHSSRLTLHVLLYSYRNASIGLSFAAFCAGRTPKKIPTPAENRMANAIDSAETIVFQPAEAEMTFEPVMPKIIPINLWC